MVCVSLCLCVSVCICSSSTEKTPCVLQSTYIWNEESVNRKLFVLMLHFYYSMLWWRHSMHSDTREYTAHGVHTHTHIEEWAQFEMLIFRSILIWPCAPSSVHWWLCCECSFGIGRAHTATVWLNWIPHEHRAPGTQTESFHFHLFLWWIYFQVLQEMGMETEIESVVRCKIWFWCHEWMWCALFSFRFTERGLERAMEFCRETKIKWKTKSRTNKICKFLVISSAIYQHTFP